MARSAHLAELSEKHRSLDRKIEEEIARPGYDEARIAALKRMKLKIKDEIAKLEVKG